MDVEAICVAGCFVSLFSSLVMGWAMTRRVIVVFYPVEATLNALAD